ncbi:MAG: hypothetical protein HZC38_00955 [Chloroflexi bacterium]|nr:hypothetical protein [Chloroflexota bacterium]MBI5081391.1 hypothetical protein [Chloroflexota bacterium]MBI5711984.1 hypothetical protein [Chloroflexota bacterium]
MTDSLPTKQVFTKGTKTYSLVEIVKAPLTMVEKGPDHTLFAFPIVAILELLLTLGMTLALLIFSLFKNAPLEELANPLVTTDPAKAPWYFMGLQELLEHMHPTLAGVILPALVVLFLIAIPYIDQDRTHAGKWFSTPRGKRITLFSAIYTAAAMPLFVILSSMFPPRELFRGVLPDLLTQSVIPGAVLFTLALLPALWLIVAQRKQTNTREVMLALFTVFIVAAAVFTLTGFLFRGPGFKLYLPWNMPNGYNPFDGL